MTMTMTMTVALPRPLGAVLVLLGALTLGGISLATVWASLAAAVDEREAKLALTAQTLAHRSARTPDRAPRPGRDLTVVADTDTLAAARIDAVVRSAIVDAGGAVLSSRSEAKHDEPSGAGTSERIEVQAVVQGSIESLQAGLFHLESGRPAILVDALSARPVEGVQDAAPPSLAPVLTATLTLSAYWERRTP